MEENDAGGIPERLDPTLVFLTKERNRLVKENQRLRDKLRLLELEIKILADVGELNHEI